MSEKPGNVALNLSAVDFSNISLGNPMSSMGARFEIDELNLEDGNIVLLVRKDFLKILAHLVNAAFINAPDSVASRSAAESRRALDIDLHDCRSFKTAMSLVNRLRVASDVFAGARPLDQLQPDASGNPVVNVIRTVDGETIDLTA